jgi:hypothetical protein
MVNEGISFKIQNGLMKFIHLKQVLQIISKVN